MTATRSVKVARWIFKSFQTPPYLHRIVSSISSISAVYRRDDRPSIPPYLHRIVFLFPPSRRFTEEMTGNDHAFLDNVINTCSIAIPPAGLLSLSLSIPSVYQRDCEIKPPLLTLGSSASDLSSQCTCRLIAHCFTTFTRSLFYQPRYAHPLPSSSSPSIVLPNTLCTQNQSSPLSSPSGAAPFILVGTSGRPGPNFFHD